ncbi:hypothetical protein ACHAPT_006764 [Fusarium lateritium]
MTIGNKIDGSAPRTQEQIANQCKHDLLVSDPSPVRDELINEWETLPDRVLYVFCGHKTTNDEIAILRSLLYQILDQVPDMVSHVKHRLGTRERIEHTLSSRVDLWAMFLSMLKDPGLEPVLCLIDGLDECPQDSTSWLLRNLRQVLDQDSQSTLPPSSRFRLVIVSQNTLRLRKCCRLRLDNRKDAIKKDVARLIEAKINEHDIRSRFGGTFAKEVEATLKRRSNGTFLWVGFAISELESAGTKVDMRSALDKIPQDLGDLYSRILNRIKRRSRDGIALLLSWVTLACRPLTSSELAEALKVDVETILCWVKNSGSLMILSEHLLWKQSTEVQHCGPDGQWHVVETVKCTTTVVKVVHASVSDFLKGKANAGFSPVNTIPMPLEFLINAEQIEFEIAKRCLREVEAHLSRPEAYQGDQFDRTLISYAICFWPQHARRCGEHLEKLMDSENAFFQSKEGTRIRSRWWHAYNGSSDSPFKDGVGTGFPLLHMGSALGFRPWTAKLLQDAPLSVDALDSKGWTALCHALEHRHAAVAHMLVDHGACLTQDIKTQGVSGNFTQPPFKPIHMAMELGPQVAESFLTKVLEGISDPRRSWRRSWQSSRDTALEESLFRKAAVMGDGQLIRILLGNRATLDSEIARLALEDALNNKRSLALIELFLQHGASTNHLDMDVLRGLNCRAAYDLVKLLLVYGMDPNNRNQGRTLLHRAVAWFGSDLAGLLLDRGAHINAQDDEGTSALAIAAACDNIDNVAVLLRHRADLAIRDAFGDTALHAAAMCTSPGSAEMLLLSGSDVNTRNDRGATALGCVLECFDLPTAELLVRQCANVDAQFDAPAPMDDWAIRVDMVRVLLAHGANSNDELERIRTRTRGLVVDNGRRIAELLR